MGKSDKGKKIAIALFLITAVFDAFLWRQIVSAAPNKNAELYFLDVGQGDSELLVMPGDIKILTDAGPDRSVAKSLEKILRSGDKYIDIGIISHPQLDHFNGFNELLVRYKFGLFVVNGRADGPGVREWPELIQKIRDNKIPLLVLGTGDAIRYGEDRIDILSPNKEWIQSGELNDTGFVEFIRTKDFRALLTADIGANVEEYLLPRFDLRADILKIGHHGSKYSSSESFLKEVDPKAAVIEAGEGNRYGHPAKETLSRIENFTDAAVFRTDTNGTVKIIAQDGILKIFAEK